MFFIDSPRWSSWIETNNLITVHPSRSTVLLLFIPQKVTNIELITDKITAEEKWSTHYMLATGENCKPWVLLMFKKKYFLLNMFQITISADSGEPIFNDPDVEKDYLLVAGAAFAKDGYKRLPTPDKDKIMALSCSYDKKRLGKQQPLLQNIAHRCREQEVTDLSGNSVKKCKLAKQGKREISSYGTNTMKSRNVSSSTSALDRKTIGSDLSESFESSGRPLFERSYTFFPNRRILKSPDKQYGLTNGLYLPSLSPGMFRKGNTAKKMPMMFGLNRNSRKTPIRPITKKSSLASTFTSLPSINYSDNEKDRVDSYVQAHSLQQNSKPSSDLGDYQFRSKAVNHQWTSRYASKSVV